MKNKGHIPSEILCGILLVTTKADHDPHLFFIVSFPDCDSRHKPKLHIHRNRASALRRQLVMACVHFKLKVQHEIVSLHSDQISFHFGPFFIASSFITLTQLRIQLNSVAPEKFEGFL